MPLIFLLIAFLICVIGLMGTLHVSNYPSRMAGAAYAIPMIGLILVEFAFTTATAEHFQIEMLFFIPAIVMAWYVLWRGWRSVSRTRNMLSGGVVAGGLAAMLVLAYLYPFEVMHLLPEWFFGGYPMA